jgi:hypothetical protein
MQRARAHRNTIQGKPKPRAGCNAQLTGQWVPKPIPTAGRGRAAPVVASVRRSTSRFHMLEYQRSCRQPRAPHSCAKRDPRAPVRITCMNVAAMPSLGGAPRRYVAAGSLRPVRSMGRIARFAAKLRMERAPERKSGGASEAVAELGGEGTLVTDRGCQLASDTVPGDLWAGEDWLEGGQKVHSSRMRR